MTSPRDDGLSEFTFKQLIEQLPVITYVETAAEEEETGWRTMVTGSHMEEKIGFSAEEWSGDSSLWASRIHPEDRERMVAMDKHSEQTGEPFDEVYRFLAKDGHVLWFHDQSIQSTNPDGVITWYGVMMDVTAEMEAEQRTKAGERRWKQLVETLPAVVFLDEPTGEATNIYTSPYSAKMLGWTPDDWKSEREFWDRIVHPDDYERVAELSRIHVEDKPGEVFDEQYRLIARDGDVVWVREVSTVVAHEDGSSGYVLGMLFDITEQKKQENQLKAAQVVLSRIDDERRAFIESVVNAQETERIRIANDLSEDAIQLITALSLRLRAAIRPDGPSQSLDDLTDMAEAVDESVIRLRRLLFELLPPALERDGLAAGIEQYLTVSAGPNAGTWKVDDKLSAEPSERIRQLAYRNVQEAVKSAAKSAPPGGVEGLIRLEEREGGLFVTIAGDGVDRSPRVKSSVLKEMDHRAQVLGGWCRSAWDDSGSTTVQMWFPAVSDGAQTPS